VDGQNSGWAGKNVLFYGQAMTWYSCNVDGWCDIPALGNTNEEMLSKYQSDVDDVLSVGKEICDSDHIDCFFATAPYGSSPGERERAMISTLEDKTASYKWAHFIDYNGFLLDEEMVGGHLIPSMFLPRLPCCGTQFATIHLLDALKLLAPRRTVGQLAAIGTKTQAKHVQTALILGNVRIKCNVTPKHLILFHGKLPR